MQLAIEGRTLNYDVIGNGADTLILVNALGTTADMWKSQLAFFAPDYTVVTYNSPGHDLAGTASSSLQDYARDLLALADHLGARRPHVVGLSLGGMIGQEYAIRHPDRILTLVLASTTPQYSDERRAMMEQRAAAAETQGMQPLVEPAIERWFTSEFRESHPEQVDRVRSMLRSANPEAYARAARAAASVDTTSRLPQIACPVLAIQGSADPGLPEDALSVLTSHIPNARSEVLQNASHLCNLEQADAFNRLVGDFLTGVTAASPAEAGVPGLPRHGDEAPHPAPGE